MADLVRATRRSRRYIVVSLLCAGVHNLVMNAGDATGLPFVPLLCASFVITVPLSYALHSNYTFERSMALVRLARFAQGQLGGFIINLLLMALMVSVFGLSVPAATLIATVALFAWNYLAARWAILLHRQSAQGA